ncbi:hypothetical protein MCR_0538 [Moraxella catarrhalis BBH18]|nr:hypothetical protein MCR_0538 [Moraxella catarrhalis BBH18]
MSNLTIIIFNHYLKIKKSVSYNHPTFLLSDTIKVKNLPHPPQLGL